MNTISFIDIHDIITAMDVAFNRFSSTGDD